MINGILLLEYIAIAVIGIYIVWGWRRGPNYWPAGRLLALVAGARAVYLASIQWQSWGESHEAVAEALASPWGNLVLTTGLLLAMLWSLYLVLRTNCKGREVDLLGRPADEAGKE